jgi:hypothetical protein
MSKIYIEAPDTLDMYSQLDQGRTIFLAGSITGATNWQSEASTALNPYFHIFNPRRCNWPALGNKIEREQISWEYKHLAIAGITLFYFDFATLAPITLLEYGKQLATGQYAPWRKTYVCIHPDYKRKNDVIIQTELVNPSLLTKFYEDLPTMYQAIIEENA